MKKSHRMVCEIDEVRFGAVGVRKGLQDAVQKRLDEGWTLRGTVNGSSDAYLIFVRKEAAKT